MKVVDQLLFLPALFQVSFVLLFFDTEDQPCFHIGVEVSTTDRSLVLQSKNRIISLIFCVGCLVVLVVGRGLPLTRDQLGMTLAHQHGGIQDQQPQAALDQHSVSAPISAMSPKSPNDPMLSSTNVQKPSTGLSRCRQSSGRQSTAGGTRSQVVALGWQLLTWSRT